MYRALLDLAQFGNTEMQAKDLNGAVEALKIKSNDSKEQCKLEVEFEVSGIFVVEWFFGALISHSIINQIYPPTHSG